MQECIYVDRYIIIHERKKHCVTETSLTSRYWATAERKKQKDEIEKRLFEGQQLSLISQM